MAQKKKKPEIPLFAQTKAIAYALLGFGLGCTAIYFVVSQVYSWVSTIVIAAGAW